MKQQKIVAQSFFNPLPSDFILVEKDFLPLNTSIIWELNTVFWKHYTIWEKTYNEHFEKTLPAGISESHRSEFIQESAEKFLDLINKLEKQKKLPKKIIVYEQGPGTGLYAKGFLNYVKKLSRTTYNRILYIVSDISLDILQNFLLETAEHSKRTKVLLQKDFELLYKKYANKILFIRHSNMWGQFPCGLFKVKQSGISEFSVRAVLDKSVDNVWRETTGLSLENFIAYLQENGCEKTILRFPFIWKDFMIQIKLQTKMKKLNSDLPSLLKKYDGTTAGEEILVSEEIHKNISFLCGLVDWDRNGYIEIVDLIAQTQSELAKEMRPLKYDGAVGFKVNGKLIKTWVKDHDKHAQFSKIRKLNTMVTITNKNLENVLRDNTFISIAEIAARKEDTDMFLAEKAKAVLNTGIDFLTFSDMAHGLPDFLSVQDLVKKNIFRELAKDQLLSVFAARRKTKNELAEIINRLKAQGVENIIAVTGDPCPKGVKNIESGFTSLDILPVLSKQFFTGAVCNAQVSDLEKTKRKIAAGARFLIVQATFNRNEWEKWCEAIQKQRLYEKIAIIPSIIPLTTIKTIDAIASLPDISISKELYNTFHSYSIEKVTIEGIKLAQNMMKECKQRGIFSGVYIYSKSVQVIEDVIAST